MREIKLTKGQVSIVDDADFEELSKYKWQAIKFNNGRFYASTCKYINGKVERVPMSRLILKPPKFMMVDHVNWDTLDNRRENIRICTPSQNQANRGKPSNNTSGYKGVSYFKRTKKWMSRINYDCKTYRLGEFEDKIEAAKAYDNKAKELHGQFAVLNFPIKELGE